MLQLAAAWSCDDAWVVEACLHAACMSLHDARHTRTGTARGGKLDGRENKKGGHGKGNWGSADGRADLLDAAAAQLEPSTP